MNAPILSMDQSAARSRWLTLGAETLYREARLLDQRQWNDWLDMFTSDCEYWVPAWKSEHEMTSDPAREISLIYYDSRAGLEDRVWRAQEGGAISATPLPRTAHMISNIELVELTENGARFRSAWVAHIFDLRHNQSKTFFGFYQHNLIEMDDGAIRIREKKIELLNDYIDTMVDFYCL